MNRNLAIIITTFNRRESLRHTLLSLHEQKLDFPFKIIVVVDGSTDGTINMLQEIGNSHIVLGNGNWWYTKCINEGVKHAISLHCDLFIALNDDAIFDSHYLKNIVTAWINNGNNSVIAPVCYTQSNPPLISFSGIKSVSGWRLKEISYIHKYSTQDPNKLSGCLPSVNVSGRGMIFSLETYNLLNGFDQSFMQYGSDTDFSYRAHKLGFPVMVCYDAKIFENEKYTSAGVLLNQPKFGDYLKSLYSKYTLNSLSKSIRYYKKHGSKWLLPFYAFYISMGSVVLYFVKRK